MANLLMGALSIVLEDVELRCANCKCKLLRNGLCSNKSERWTKLMAVRCLTRSSVRWSSGMSVSFSPWTLGMTSCPILGQLAIPL